MLDDIIKKLEENNNKIRTAQYDLIEKKGENKLDDVTFHNDTSEIFSACGDIISNINQLKELQEQLENLIKGGKKYEF